MEQANVYIKIPYRKIRVTNGQSSRPWLSSGYHACHWTQGSRVQSRPKKMDF
jgi:hypothetical protein